MTARAGTTASALAAIGILLAACGGDDDTATAREPSGDHPIVEVVAKGIKWVPDELTAEIGTVTFMVDNQDGGIRHNLRVKGNGVDEATELESGKVVQYLDVTFDEAGSYELICDIHPNMDGTVEVS